MAGLLLFIPLTALLLTYAPRAGWRRALLLAMATWGVLTTFITEALSMAGALTFAWVCVCWTFVALVTVIVAWRTRGRLPPVAMPRGLPLAGVVVCVILLTITATTALVAPPNNWDAMTYHMPRVLHWIDNQSVAFYPTHNLRQLHQNPFAHYAVLQWQLLTGGDRFANVPQWIALAGCAVGVSLIAQRLGATASGQTIAALAAVTVPMAILQASNPQSDLVLALWLVCFAVAVLEPNVASPANVLFAGAALGLAILTKATTYALAPPLCVWFGVRLVREKSWRGFASGCAVVVIALAINVGHLSRNYALAGHPLGPQEEVGTHAVRSYRNDGFTVRGFISNLSRNLAIQARSSNQPVNRVIEAAVVGLHDFMGIGINDPATTWPRDGFSMDYSDWAMPEMAGSPLHLLLGAGCAASLFTCRLTHKRRALALFGCIAAAFVLFCIVLRWQPTHARLQLPLVVLSCALMGVVLEQCWSRPTAWAGTALLVLAALPLLLNNPNHPWRGRGNIWTTPRSRQYLTRAPWLEATLDDIARQVSAANAHCVGLVANNDEVEYPLWLRLRTDNPAVRLHHVQISNPSARLPQPRPCEPQRVVVLKTDVGQVEVVAP